VIDVVAIRLRWEQAERFLDERGRRLFAASAAQREGPGGVTALSQATGLARSTINRGIRELRSGRNEIGSRVRRPGAGRKSAVTHQPGLPAALERLIEDAIRGDPCSPLRWISRSQRHLVKALAAQGFQVSQRVVANLLRELNYSCQANRKTREGGNHPDRDAQFAHINATVKAAIAAGEPAISVDTKKKELVGDFKNNGRELRRQGDPEPVRVHDFKIPELGKVAPYGVYDIAANHGWVSVGIDAGAFAVESIRRWWYRLGQARYPSAKHLTITADCGGSNGPQVRLWKRELQRLANETGLKITVTHLPPGTSSRVDDWRGGSRSRG
jgi:Rhodopirellula transposase DDE domain